MGHRAENKKKTNNDIGKVLIKQKNYSEKSLSLGCFFFISRVYDLTHSNQTLSHAVVGVTFNFGPAGAASVHVRCHGMRAMLLFPPNEASGRTRTRTTLSTRKKNSTYSVTFIVGSLFDCRFYCFSNKT